MKAIKYLMACEGLTQTDLAALLKKSQPTIWSILNGKSNLQPDDAKILIKKYPKYLSWEKIYENTGSSS